MTAIERDPMKRGGKPVLRGTRVTVGQILAELADGQSLNDLCDDMDLDLEWCKKLLNELSDAHECKPVASGVPDDLRERLNDLTNMDKSSALSSVEAIADVNKLLAIADAKPEEKQPCWVVKLSDEVTDALSEEVVAAYKAIAESKSDYGNKLLKEKDALIDVLRAEKIDLLANARAGWQEEPPTDGIGIIAAERRKQIRKWPSYHDDGHDKGILAVVAAALAVEHTDAHVEDAGLGRIYYENGWQDVWGLLSKHRRNDLKRLAIAGALIAAEIDRIMRDNAEPKREPVVDCCGGGRQGELIALIEKLVKHDSYLKCKEVIDVIEKFRAT